MIKPLKFQKQSQLPLSAETLATVEKELGLNLPSTFVEFCRRYNGGITGPENSFYPVPESYRDFYNEYEASSEKAVGVVMDGLYGLGKDLEACYMPSEFLSFKRSLVIGILPIGFDLLGNYAVLRTDDLSGRVYWRDHELWEAPEVPALFPIADSLESFYNALEPDPYLDENN